METIDAGDVPLDRVVDQLFADSGLRALLGGHGAAAFVLVRSGLVPKFYQELVQNSETIDATTRHHIAFIVFHGNQSSIIRPGDNGRGYKYHVQGLSISEERSIVLDERDSKTNPLQFSRDFTNSLRAQPSSAPVERISRASDRAATAVMKRFSVPESVLPCLLFVDGSRLEDFVIVQLSPTDPMASLYKDVLTPLSDEFQSLEAFWDQRARIESHKCTSEAALKAAAEFPEKAQCLNQALQAVREEVRAAEAQRASEADHLLSIRGERERLEAFCREYKAAETLDQRVALISPSSDQYSLVQDMKSRLASLEEQKKTAFSLDMATEDREKLARISSVVNKLRGKLGNAAALPYTRAKNRLQEIDVLVRQSWELRVRALREKKGSLERDMRYLDENRKHNEESLERERAFQLEMEENAAANQYETLKRRGYDDAILLNRYPRAVDVVKTLSERDRIGFSPSKNVRRRQMPSGGIWKHVTPGLQPAKELLLFVHGLGGSARTTWGRMPDLLMEDPQISERFAVDYYSFPTALFRLPFTARAPKIQELAAGLRTQIEHGDYARINLICHSLGGLIARRYLTEEVKTGRSLRVDRLALFAVPNNGASLASLARHLSWRQNQIKQLCRDADIIEFLNEDWMQADLQNKIRTKFIIGTQDRIVDRFSAASYWGNPDVETVVGRGHIDLVKPENRDEMTIKILRRFLAD